MQNVTTQHRRCGWTDGRPIRWLAVVVVVALGPRVPAAESQVKARQGEVAVEVVRKEVIASPMILELPFPHPFRTSPEAARTVEYDLQQYECEKIHFTSFRVTAGTLKKDRHPVAFSVTLRNPPGIDKRVDLLIELVKSTNDVVASTRVNNVSIEEGDRATRVLTAAVPPADLNASPPLTLRMTLTVRDDP